MSWIRNTACKNIHLRASVVVVLAILTAGNGEHAEGGLDGVGGVAWHGISSQRGGPQAVGLGRPGSGGGRAGTPRSRPAHQPHQARQEAGGGRGGTAGHLQQQGGFSDSGNYEQIVIPKNV
jgi:hypothetical protein